VHKKISFIFAVCGVFLLFLGGIGVARGQSVPDGGKKKQQLYFFYSPTCKECADARIKTIPFLQSRFGGELDIIQRDISLLENYKFYLSLRQAHPEAVFKDRWPVFYLGGNFLALESSETAEAFVRRAVGSSGSGREAGVKAAAVDIKKRFSRLGLPAVILAGLVDGINPCAFTVIVFFISFLALQGYSRKELILVGTVFILAVFCAYIMIGLGIFGFLYKLNHFWRLANAINFAAGIFSLIVGVLAVYDIIVFYFKGGNDKMALRLPSAVKAKIQGLIGSSYRRKKDAGSVESERRSLRAHVVTAFSTGFLVSLLESVCTGQMYLPTIVFVLKTAEFKAKACLYLLLYNLMFILPLAVILMVSLLGVTSNKMAGFVGRKVPLLKAAMAVIFFVMGFLLIRRS
jgi:hypothetical protein